MPRREPGDPWYTLLYRDPHRLWWAPALAAFPVLILALHYLADDSLTEAGGLAVVFCLAGLFGSYLRFRRDTP